MAELNGLTQGSLTSDEYIKKAKGLYATLGDDIYVGYEVFGRDK